MCVLLCALWLTRTFVKHSKVPNGNNCLTRSKVIPYFNKILTQDFFFYLNSSCFSEIPLLCCKLLVRKKGIYSISLPGNTQEPVRVPLAGSQRFVDSLVFGDYLRENKRKKQDYMEYFYLSLLSYRSSGREVAFIFFQSNCRSIQKSEFPQR